MGCTVAAIVFVLWALLVVIGQLAGLTIFLAGWLLKLIVILALVVWLWPTRTRNQV